MRLFPTMAMTTAAVVLAGSAWAAGSMESFLPKAIQGNLAEIQMGKLAQAKGNTQEVRDFGQKLVTDHTAANQEAVALAAKAGVTVPTAPSDDQQDDYNSLNKKVGADFDKQFLSDMESAHKDAISLYEDESAEKHDGAVQAYAASTLSTLRSHLATIQTLQKMKK